MNTSATQDTYGNKTHKAYIINAITRSNSHHTGDKINAKNEIMTHKINKIAVITKQTI